MNILDNESMPVLEYEAALNIYFDALLQDVSHSKFTSESRDVCSKQEILEKNNALEVAATIAVSPVSGVAGKGKQISKIPDWAAAAFQCLLFSANGVKFAVPLIKLHSVINLTESLKLVPYEATWFLGLLPWQGVHVKVIDTYKLMAREGSECMDFKSDAQKQVLLVGDGSWGLVCDDASKILTLYSDQIQWDGDSVYGAWCAGTVKESTCTLLDVDKFSIPA